MSQEIASLSLISSFYEKEKNYFDVYLPFIIKTIDGHVDVSINDISEELKRQFGFQIPVFVIKTILREHESKYFALRRPNQHNWTASLRDAGTMLLAQITEEETRVNAALDALFANFSRFYNAETSKTLSIEEARDQLYDFIKCNIHYMVDNSVAQPTDDGAIVVRFLHEIQIAGSSQVETIEQLWKSLIIKSDIQKDSGKKTAPTIVDRLELYIDTNVAFSLLGLHNPLQNEAIKELLELINQNKQIRLIIADITILEINRILDSYNAAERSFMDIEVDSVFYYLKKLGYGRAGVLSLRENVATKLNEIGVEIRTMPAIVDGQRAHYYSQVYDRLITKRRERNSRMPDAKRRSDDAIIRSVNHDAGVISVVLVGKNKQTNSIQKAKALFLTSSPTLANDYMSISKAIEGLPAVIRDTSLTSALYIINPSQDGGPSIEHLLLLHRRVLFVDYGVWSVYQTRVKALLVSGKIDYSEYSLLVSSSKAVSNFLIDATPGEIDDIKIEGVLGNVKGEVAQLSVEKASLQSEMSSLEKEKTELEAQVEREKINHQKEKFALLMDKYTLELSSYNDKKNRFISTKIGADFRKLRALRWGYGTFSIICIAACIGLIIFSTVVVGIAPFVLFVLTWIRAFFSHDKVGTAFQVVFSKRKRESYEKNQHIIHEATYMQENPSPIEPQA